MRFNNILLLLAFIPFASYAQTERNPFGKALVPDMIADASIELIGDTFYCYATTDGYGRHLDTSGPPVVWKSKDFVHWHFNGVYFPSASKEKYWAPSKAVHARDGKWYIYPTINGIMHVAVSDSPDGPFRLAAGPDVFVDGIARESTLRKGDDIGGIDAEVFIDDDGQAYCFWGRRNACRLGDDMMTLSDHHVIPTRRGEYSEGPIFFKRKGIYYYLYTIGGDEHYEYYYQMSRVSPFGPWETPDMDVVSTTSVVNGVYGPGHGCVFNDGDDYYFAFLEFGRRSTNRQTYVNKMYFNEDGTIRTVDVDLNGVGALRDIEGPKEIHPESLSASTVRQPLHVAYNKDVRCRRTEHFLPAFAADGANGSRWMADDDDKACWLVADFGKSRSIGKSEIAFVRPTAGHAYILEGSNDGQHWTRCGGHADIRIQSPHTDTINARYRYMRVTITEGVKGVWEWRFTK
ncbi:MAG: family 43 glycosylhydrolase [Bacteroidaceae bacterium]|nr:family 43 glycosylhydrolase [Bacteroidaceae bacterium]